MIRCPKCQGECYPTEGDDFRCMTCGHEWEPKDEDFEEQPEGPGADTGTAIPRDPDKTQDTGRALKPEREEVKEMSQTAEERRAYQKKWRQNLSPEKRAEIRRKARERWHRKHKAAQGGASPDRQAVLEQRRKENAEKSRQWREKQKAETAAAIPAAPAAAAPKLIKVFCMACGFPMEIHNPDLFLKQ